MNHQYYKSIFVVLLFYLFASCSGYEQDSHLESAIRSVDTNPAVANAALDSVLFLERLSPVQQMQYRVTLVQTRYRTGQDLRGDTVIFEAQRYFEANPLADWGMKADSYAGLVYAAEKKHKQAIEAFGKAQTQALSQNNNVFAAHCFNNVGMLYFEQRQMKEAIAHYQEALTYHRKADNTCNYQLQTLTSIGRAYEHLELHNKAMDYFVEAQDLSYRCNNGYYQTTLKNNIGKVYLNQKNYARASRHLLQAFRETTDKGDLARVSLNLARLYTELGKPDKAAAYVGYIEDQVHTIANPETQMLVYQQLAHYYTLAGNATKASHFIHKERDAEAAILKRNSEQQLAPMALQHEARVHVQTMESAATLAYVVWISILIATVIATLGAAVSVHCRLKLNHLTLKPTLPNSESKDELINRGFFLKDVYHLGFSALNGVVLKEKTEKKYLRVEGFPLLRLLNKELEEVAAQYLLKFGTEGEEAVHNLSPGSMMLLGCLMSKMKPEQMVFILSDATLLDPEVVKQKAANLAAELAELGIPLFQTADVLG